MLPASSVLLAALLFAFSAFAQAPLERTRLYTDPDSGSPGGLKGRISKPEQSIEQILAIPTDAPEQVYAGQISGSRRESFQFTGLPMGKYDLVVIYAGSFYEGFQLSRDASTLTPADLEKINATFQKSEPYWTKKVIHRVEGQTGRAQFARAVGTFSREKGSDLLMTTFEGKYNRPDWRRTFKLLIFKDVGPGWQIVRVRDLYPVWVKPGLALPTHHYSAALNQLRVADRLKDLGDLDLTAK
jgi:hypothetical protein